MLPTEFAAAIEEEISAARTPNLARAAACLTERYRDPGTARGPLSEGERLAYLAVRVPATFAAVGNALGRLAEAMPDFAPASILDLGAGPGTALWAAVEVFPTLSHATAIEADPGFHALGSRLARASGSHAVSGATWLRRDALAGELPTADLVVVSYAFNELHPTTQRDLIDRAWSATAGALVLVEPGTPAAFNGVLAARGRLLALGAHLAAPCPHALPCPMEGTPSWCHFAQRLPRTRLHRQLKGGALGYEDEKFSYLTATRHPAPNTPPRISAPANAHKAAVELPLCTREGTLAVEKVSRSDREDYKRAKKLEWGDGW